MAHYDVVVVGAGHNGLTCACYLARAGRKRARARTPPHRRRRRLHAGRSHPRLPPRRRLLRAHHDPPHARAARAGAPSSFGLEYLEMDPWAHYPILGTGTGISFYRDLDQTCASIAKISPRDAEAYRKFVAALGRAERRHLRDLPPAAHARPHFRHHVQAQPAQLALAQTLVLARHLAPAHGPLRLAHRGTLRASGRPHRAHLWLSAQSGPAPTEMASGDMLGWNAMIHKSGAKRAKGGSGALTQALARCLESHGGEIVCNGEVSSITRSGDAWAITFSGRENPTHRDGHHRRNVVGACHLHTLFNALARRSARPEKTCSSAPASATASA